ncbi:MAG: hypothetical protein QOD65_2252 [Gaiellales bacterium]|jgi:hypothetical protein|nr:hypothetical protein [Gaiellales bacterium]MDX6597591.1 hypothetical protein [Gaiellales bacterium]
MSQPLSPSRPAPTLRRLSLVQPAQVEIGPDGTPVRLDDRPVEQIRERWVVEEGWWTDVPVRRAYAELVLADGGLAVVFEDLRGGGWHRHASASGARRGGRRRR